MELSMVALKVPVLQSALVLLCLGEKQMGIVDQIKEIAALAQKVQNLELYHKLVAFQAEIVALQNDNFELHEKVRALQEKVNLREQLSFEYNFYWLQSSDSKDGPYCPKCYNEDQEARRLLSEGSLRFCPSCGLVLQEDGCLPSLQERKRITNVMVLTHDIGKE
jgi:hypothetical protein